MDFYDWCLVVFGPVAVVMIVWCVAQIHAGVQAAKQDS